MHVVLSPNWQDIASLAHHGQQTPSPTLGTTSKFTLPTIPQSPPIEEATAVPQTAPHSEASPEEATLITAAASLSEATPEATPLIPQCPSLAAESQIPTIPSYDSSQPGPSQQPDCSQPASASVSASGHSAAVADCTTPVQQPTTATSSSSPKEEIFKEIVYRVEPCQTDTDKMLEGSPDVDSSALWT